MLLPIQRTSLPTGTAQKEALANSSKPLTLVRSCCVESNLCPVDFAQYFSTGVLVSGFIPAPRNSERCKMTGNADNVGFLATGSGVKQFQLSLRGWFVRGARSFLASGAYPLSGSEPAPADLRNPQPPNKLAHTGNANYGWAYRVVDSQGLASLWTSPSSPYDFNIYLYINSSNSAVVAYGDGHQETYAPSGTGGYISEPGIFNVLTSNGGTYTLTTKEQQQPEIDRIRGEKGCERA
jgi:hypothetical protein